VRALKRIALTIILAAVATIAVPATARAAPVQETPVKVRVQDYFTPAQIERAKDYRGPVYVIGFSSLALNLVVLGLLGLGTFSRSLTGWAKRVTKDGWVRCSLMLAAVVTFVPAVFELPFTVARWRHDRNFGLATNSVWGLLADYAKATGFSLVAAAVLALVYVSVAKKFARAWPFLLGAAGVALTFLVIFILPLIYEPAFNSFKNADPATRARVEALAAREGVRVDRVLISNASIRTTTENAYVSGLGSTKRVVLYDTLVKSLPPREVDLVVAHEFGHVAHNDILKGALVGSAGVVAAVAAIWWLLRRRGLLDRIGARDHADPAVLPFIAFFLAAATLVTLPLANWISRHEEAAADHAAIVATNDPGTAVRLEVDLAVHDIADLQPNGFIHWAFFTHPSALERIQAAVNYEAR
jgi:STE24 endopeptidase